MQTPKSLILLFLVSALIIVGACRKPVANQNANSTASPATEAPFGGKANAGDKFFFRGTIANNLSIEMSLVREGERLTGTYFYPRVGKNINLSGTIDKDGNVDLKESDEGGKDTGIFKGKWKAATDSPDSSLNEITGKWSKPDGSKATEFQVSQQPIAFTAAVKVNPKVIKETNKEKRYAVEAEYPQIEGDARFDGFNREARNLVTKDVAAFKAGEESSAADAGSELPTETQQSSLNMGYEIRFATDELISVEFTEATYEAGAAHGNSATTVLNYDVKNGKKLALGDLFNPKVSYLGVISSYCISNLRDRAKREQDSMIDEDMMKTGAAPQASNYQACAITKKGLWVTFDPYQVAAYAAGPQHVLVPYSALKDIIKSDGPLAPLAK
jgi:hypothetical protein